MIDTDPAMMVDGVVRSESAFEKFCYEVDAEIRDVIGHSDWQQPLIGTGGILTRAIADLVHRVKAIVIDLRRVVFERPSAWWHVRYGIESMGDSKARNIVEQTAPRIAKDRVTNARLSEGVHRRCIDALIQREIDRGQIGESAAEAVTCEDDIGGWIQRSDLLHQLNCLITNGIVRIEESFVYLTCRADCFDLKECQILQPIENAQ